MSFWYATKSPSSSLSSLSSVPLAHRGRSTQLQLPSPLCIPRACTAIRLAHAEWLELVSLFRLVSVIGVQHVAIPSFIFFAGVQVRCNPHRQVEASRLVAVHKVVAEHMVPCLPLPACCPCRPSTSQIPHNCASRDLAPCTNGEIHSRCLHCRLLCRSSLCSSPSRPTDSASPEATSRTPGSLPRCTCAGAAPPGSASSGFLD